jgi:P4 family phage/plasmid primase-like protien
MRWTGRVWEESTDIEVTETVRLWALGHFSDVFGQQGTDPNRNLSEQIKGWYGVLSASKLRSLVGLAKGILMADADAFDSHPDLLNCPNGVVDLRTGTLMPSDPDLLLTKVTGCAYVKDARHPDWDRALTALPADVVDWFKIRMGQGATGHMPPDDRALICQGGGQNAKTSIMDTIKNSLGKYRIAVADRALIGNASEQHPTEMMDFMGARLAVLEETPESRQLDTVRLKKLTGTEEITARKIRQDSVTFKATHSLVINTNFELLVNETDHGTWRRLALVVWPYTFREREEDVRSENDRLADTNLRFRLRDDPRVHEAVLAWLVDGARTWYEADRIFPPLPESVRRDTQAWREKSDPILGFLGDTVVFDRGSHVMATELWDAFSAWMDEKKNKPWSSKTFLARFGGHDACTQNGVVQKKQRRNGSLSRRGAGGPAPATYSAWIGLRFQDPEGGGEGDPGGGADVGDPFTGVPDNTADLGSSGCSGTTVNLRVTREISVNSAAGTPGTGVEGNQSSIMENGPEQDHVPAVPEQRQAAGPTPGTAFPAVPGEPRTDTHSDDEAPLSAASGTIDQDQDDDPFAGWGDVR